MLMGEYSHNIDPKGRMIFPAKLLEGLGLRFVVTKGLGERCLAVYSYEEWDLLAAKIKNLPMSKARALQRVLFAGAVDVEPDKQGRILLPAALREYAGLQKDVVVAGAANHAEIWDKDQWLAECSKLDEQEIAGIMEELGL